MNINLAQDLDDALATLTDKTKMSKNSLINLALSKFLVEFGVIDLHKETQEKTEVLKSTDYCDLLKQGKLKLGEFICTIGRINVKASGEDEIRFAYYKLNKTIMNG